jgi:hypothetical protein
MATPTGYTDLRNPVLAMSHGLPVLEVEPHIRTSSPLRRSTHRNICIEVRVDFSELNTWPSLCQRRLQPHLHPAGYGNDRANHIGSFATDKLLRHRIAEVALLATKDALIVKKKRMTQLMFASANTFHIAL